MTQSPSEHCTMVLCGTVRVCSLPCELFRGDRNRSAEERRRFLYEIRSCITGNCKGCSNETHSVTAVGKGAEPIKNLSSWTFSDTNH